MNFPNLPPNVTLKPGTPAPNSDLLYANEEREGLPVAYAVPGENVLETTARFFGPHAKMLHLLKVDGHYQNPEDWQTIGFIVLSGWYREVVVWKGVEVTLVSCPYYDYPKGIPADTTIEVRAGIDLHVCRKPLHIAECQQAGLTFHGYASLVIEDNGPVVFPLYRRKERPEA